MCREYNHGYEAYEVAYSPCNHGYEPHEVTELSLVTMVSYQVLSGAIPPQEIPPSPSPGLRSDVATASVRRPA